MSDRTFESCFPFTRHRDEIERAIRNAYAQEIRQWLAHFGGVENGTKRG